MTPVDLPHSLFQRTAEPFVLESTSTSLGRGLSGVEQIAWTENRRWIGTVSFRNMVGQDINRVFAFGDSLKGRLRPIRVDLCNLGTPGYASDLARFYSDLGIPQEYVTAGSIPFSTGVRFSNGAGFALPQLENPTVVSPAPEGASKVHVMGAVGTSIVIGGFFSANDFLYRVESKDGDVLRFNPPLREALTAGATLEVLAPKIRVRLAEDSGWNPQSMAGGREVAGMSVNLVEDFHR